MVYLCLLHGVKFNADVARGWVEAGLLSFCFSCVVTATGVQFVKSVIAIVIALVKRHKLERSYVYALYTAMRDSMPTPSDTRTRCRAPVAGAPRC